MEKLTGSADVLWACGQKRQRRKLMSWQNLVEYRNDSGWPFGAIPFAAASSR